MQLLDGWSATPPVERNHAARHPSYGRVDVVRTDLVEGSRHPDGGLVRVVDCNGGVNESVVLGHPSPGTQTTTTY